MWKLTSELNGITTAAIAGHIRPDGDCVGSCMGLYHYIRANYPDIKVDVFLETVSEKFSYIEDMDVIKHECVQDQAYDVFFVLDCGDRERLGFAVEYFKKAEKTVCIDHHISNTAFADVNYVKTDAAATCEILYSMMEYEDINIQAATALYTGIVHDTGVFKHSNTTENAMITAGRLLAKGVAHTDIINNSFFQKTYLQNQILGRALLESVVFYHGTCIATALREKELMFYGVDKHDLDGIIDQLIITKGIECAIFMYEIEPHVYKVSLRSKKIVDVSVIAVHFGGGGHIRAAGCTMTGSEHDVINNISSQIERQYLEYEKQTGTIHGV